MRTLIASLLLLATLTPSAHSELVDESLCSCWAEPFWQDAACNYTTVCDRVDSGTVLNSGTSTIVDSSDLHCSNCPIAGDCDKETTGAKTCSWNAKLSYTTQWKVTGSVSGEASWWIAKWKATAGGSFGESTTITKGVGGSVVAPPCTWRHDVAEARIVTGKIFQLNVAYSWLSTEYGPFPICAGGKVAGKTTCTQESALVFYDDKTLVVEDQLVRNGKCTSKVQKL
jgi:hypothetical protein